MQIKTIDHPSFQMYGTILSHYDIEEVVHIMKEIPIPEDVVYEPSFPPLENTLCKKRLETCFFGQMSIQMGYCNGHNRFLNALEYHRSSEVNIALTDMYLMLGTLQDMDAEYTYDSVNIEIFYVPKGMIIELYATTLHYAPCQCSEEGFKCVVVLPKGTNEPCVKNVSNKGEDKLLFARNKWLLAHHDAHIEGAYPGLLGENIQIEGEK